MLFSIQDIFQIDFYILEYFTIDLIRNQKRRMKNFKLLLILFLISLYNNSFINCGNLSVMPEPEQQTNKVQAWVNDSFVIACRLIASSDQKENPNKLIWLSPSNQIITSKHERVYTQLLGDKLRLFFDKLLVSDAGNYTCTDGLSNETKIIDLVLFKKITFYDTPTDQIINPILSDKVIRCKASGDSEPEIAWFHNGMNLELNPLKYTKTDQGLVVNGINSEDEGIYYCQAYQPTTGELKKIAINVQVLQAPKWAIQPNDIELRRGDNVTIKCEAYAKPLPFYRWTRNGVQIVNNSANLTIQSLDQNAKANYSCIAENILGKIESNFHVTILISPQIELIGRENAAEGDKTSLICLVREAYPKATIKWMYSDTKQYINETDLIKIVENDTCSELNFLNVTRLDERSYTCVSENKLALAERQIKLLVEYGPKLVLNDETKKFYYSWFSENISYPVVLTCIADGSPKPSITWLFKNNTIKSDNITYRILNDEFGLSKLEITPQSLTNFGNYTCHAENKIGSEDFVIELRVASAPKFAPYLKVKMVNPESVLLDIYYDASNVNDGGIAVEAYQIEWTVASNWTISNKTYIPVNLAQNLKISSLTPNAEYLFRVGALNKVGLGELSKEFTIKTAQARQPDSVKPIGSKNCETSSKCQIKWMVESNGGSPIIEYLIRWRRINNKDSLNKSLNTYEEWSSIVTVKQPITNYEIINLKDDSFYEIDIIARNELGQSTSQPFEIRTLTSPSGQLFIAFSITYALLFVSISILYIIYMSYSHKS